MHRGIALTRAHEQANKRTCPMAFIHTPVTLRPSRRAQVSTYQEGFMVIAEPHEQGNPSVRCRLYYGSHGRIGTPPWPLLRSLHSLGWSGNYHPFGGATLHGVACCTQ